MIPPAAFLFDLDGVLLNTEPLNKKTWQSTSNYFGYLLKEEQLKTLLGMRKIECAKKIIEWSEDKIDLNKLLRIQKRFHKEILINVEPIEGAQEIVSYLTKKDINMAIVTSSTYKSVAYKSKDNNWLNNIETRVYGDDPLLKKGKPNPDPYLLAAKKLRVNPKDCWAVEDSETGSKSALKAGCKVFLLNNNETNRIHRKLHSFRENPIRINKIDEILFILEGH